MASFAEELEKLNKQNKNPAAPQMKAETVDPNKIADVAAQKVAPAFQSANTAGVEAAKQPQQQALQMQQAAAEGKAPSFAEALLKKQGEDAMKQQASLMAGKSFDPAAVRQAQNIGAQAQMEAGQQAAALRAQEMATARQQFGDISTQVRGQEQQLSMADQAALLQQRQQDVQQADLNLRAQMANQGVDLDVLKTNAAAGNQAAIANMDAALRAQGMDDARIANYMQTALGITGQALQKKQLEQQASQAKTDMWMKLGGALVGAGGTLGAAAITAAPAAAAASDINLKENIKEGGKDASSFLDALTAYTYNYKKGVPNTKDGEDYTSIMAQDLEKAGPVGKQMVKDTPQGKMVDYGQGFAGMLAAMVDMNKRLKKVEK